MAEPPAAELPGFILWVTAPMPSAFGGMQTHARFFYERMTLRGWRVIPVRGRVSTHWVPPPAPSVPLPTVALVEAWSWTELTPGLRAAWPGVPIIVRSGGNDVPVALARAKYELDPGGYADWVTRITGSVDLVIANSLYSAAELAESDLGSISAEVVVGGAVEVDAAVAARNEPPVVMIAGRFVEWKGFDDCIEVVARVQQTTEVTLLMAGDGELRRELEELAEKRLRPGSWRFAGALTHDECLAEIARSDVFLSMAKSLQVDIGTSTYVHTEAMGRAVCEALVAGVPVVATAVGGVPELLRDGGGTLIAEAEIEAASEAVIRHLEAGRLDEETVSELRERLGWDSLVAKYEQIFLRLSRDHEAAHAVAEG